MPISNLGTCFPLAHVVVYMCVPLPNQDLAYHQHIPWSICVCLSQTRTLLSTSSCRGLFVYAYPKPGHCCPPAHVVVYLCVPILNQDIAFHQLMSWSICVQWFEVKGSWSFCWYVLNLLPSMLPNDMKTNRENMYMYCSLYLISASEINIHENNHKCCRTIAKNK